MEKEQIAHDLAVAAAQLEAFEEWYANSRTEIGAFDKNDLRGLYGRYLTFYKAFASIVGEQR